MKTIPAKNPATPSSNPSIYQVVVDYVVGSGSASTEAVVKRVERIKRRPVSRAAVRNAVSLAVKNGEIVQLRHGTYAAPPTLNDEGVARIYILRTLANLGYGKALDDWSLLSGYAAETGHYGAEPDWFSKIIRRLLSDKQLAEGSAPGTFMYPLDKFEPELESYEAILGIVAQYVIDIGGEVKDYDVRDYLKKIGHKGATALACEKMLRELMRRDVIMPDLEFGGFRPCPKV